PSPVPSDTPVPPSAVPGNVLLLYDNVSFTLHNQSGHVLSLEGIIFRSGSGSWNARSWGASLYQRMPVDSCLRMRSVSSRNRQPPAVCGSLYGLQLVGPPAQFWLNTDSFDVVRSGEVIATCPTNQQTCLIFIP
ncbi:MAG: hypothetical protein K8J31_14680, partial [Anaerolineae bacterium]|nr:hypothetical protein [Anaerolineae bacterium]